MSWIDVFRAATQPVATPPQLATQEERPFAVVAADVRRAAYWAERCRLGLRDAATLEERLSAIAELQHCDGRLSFFKAAARTAGAREGLAFAEVEARIELESGEGERDARKGR